MTSPKVPKKDRIELMIIGAQKAGTTSLKNYLGEHPALQSHPQKEFSFFSDTSDHSRGYTQALKKYFQPRKHDSKLIAKNALLYTSATGLERLHAHNPDCHLIYILRDPVDRAYSAYQMEHNYGTLTENFESLGDLLQDRNRSSEDWRYDILIGMGHYSDHLASIFRFFPKEQVHIFTYEQLKSDSTFICKTIFKVLAVDDSFCPDVSKIYNQTKKVQSHRYSRVLKRLLRNSNPIKKFARSLLPGNSDYKVGEVLRNVNRSKHTPPPMSDSMRKLLQDHYRPYNESLSKMTGMDFSSWNK